MAAAAAKSLQLCPTVRPHRQQSTRLPHPWDSPGKNTGVGCHFLVQCMKVKVKSLSRVWLLTTPWTAAQQAPLSMGLSRQEYWSGVPLPSLPGTRGRDKYIYSLLFHKRFCILLNLSWYQSKSDFYASKYYLQIPKKWFFFFSFVKQLKNSGKKMTRG